MSSLNERWQNVRRILAMRLDNLGDVIMTGPALRAVKETLPGAELTLMVSHGAWGAADLLPWVDHVLAWRSLWQDLGDLAFEPAREFGLIQTLQALRFDAAIIFTSFAQTPHVAAYAAYLGGIPLRLGEPKDFGGAVLSDTPATPSPWELHQVERNLRLVEAVGFAARDRSLAIGISPLAQARAHALLARHGRAPGSPYIVLCPWTSCPARNYPHFGAVAEGLAHASSLPLIITGVARDGAAAAALVSQLGAAAIDLAGQTSAEELAALIAGAALVVTNNTASMHLADATRTPQLVLFAGTELEAQWAPRDGPARLLRRPTPCRPCFKLSCPHGLACLDIAPEEVVAAARELLHAHTPGRGAPVAAGEAQP